VSIDAFQAVGKLATLGLSEPWQVALLLPTNYDDFTTLARDAQDLDPKSGRPIRLTIITAPRSSFDRGVPKTTLTVADETGERYRATVFGDTAAWREALTVDSQIVALATAKVFAQQLSLTIKSLIEPTWVGRLRPKYSAKDFRDGPDALRLAVHTRLAQAIPRAAEFIAQHMARIGPPDQILRDLGGEGWTIEAALWQAHAPASQPLADHAGRLCRRLAHLAAVHKMRAGESPATAAVVTLPTLEARIAQLPFTLTRDQRAAVDDVARLIGQPKPARHVLSGDVGVGKSAPAYVLAAAVHDAPGDHRVMLLSPNTLLAQQLHREFDASFPDVGAVLVTGESDAAESIRSAKVLIGTSALLHRDTGARPFSLVLVDEQHRFSRAQREHHIQGGAHLVEMSATPIPRTQALIRFGDVTVSELRETHRPKTFITTLFEGRESARQLMEAVRPVVRAGDALIVVLPKREVTTAVGDTDLLGDAPPPTAPRGAIDDRHSVEASFDRWNTMFPDQVRTLTSDDDDATKAQVLDDLRSGRANVILSTSVIEVGVSLPNLYHIVVVCPERHGLMALHQLRGRVARNGGEGYCYLYAPEPLSEERRRILQTFCAVTDGFKLADFDLQMRGAGDLSKQSTRQSGADNTFLFGVPIEVRVLNEVMPVWDRWAKAS
jgi:ATP-dependent DNA helicase RecG